jgi:hypothetical protein
MADEADGGSARYRDCDGLEGSDGACLAAAEYDRRREGSHKGVVKMA